MPAPAIADSSCATPPAEIIPSLSLDALLARRDAAVAQLAAVAQAITRYAEIGDAIGLGTGEPFDRLPYKYRKVFDGREGPRIDRLDEWLAQATASVDAALWDHLLDKSGLRTFMDHRARKEWDEQIDRNETPPLTTENITSTFRNLHAARGELFERGVLSLFRALSWDYKSNLPHRFGTRIILRYLVSSYGHPSYDTCHHVDDLLRVFHLLDGRPEPDHRNGVYSRLTAAHRAGEELVDEYVRIRTFKNGNGHVYFVRAELVDQLNRILAKHHPNALPPMQS